MMDFSMLLALKVLGVVVGTYVFMFGFVKKINEWRYVSSLGEKKHCLPPGDVGWPLVGNNLPFLKAFTSSEPDSFIHNLHQRYGRIGIYKTHLFRRPTIIVSIPETCRKVLKDDERFRPGYPEVVRQLTSKWFHGTTDSEQKQVHSIIKAAINGHEELSKYIENIEDIVIKSLDKWSSMNEPVELLKEMKQIALKVIAHITLDSTADKSIIGFVEKHYADLVNGLVSAPINFPGFAFYKAHKARNTLLKILTGVFDEHKAKSTQIKHPNEKRGLVNLLMESKGDNGQKLTDSNLIDLLLMLLLAGHETTASAITWAMIHLHDHPEMLHKAKQEQDEILKRRSGTQKGLTFKDIREMHYLQKVIDETMRISNLAAPIFRQAKVDVNINGYQIPKGWQVLVSNRAVHMDPEVYQNPKEFIPTRWENNKPKAGSFLPFGTGTRMCPGADLAKLEMFIFLHYFLLNYKLELINPGGPVIYLPIPRPADNCLAKIKKI